jgi:hypothetical protein
MSIKNFKSRFFYFLTVLFLASGTLSASSSAKLTNKLSFARPSKDSVIKILAIGNSFSEDAIEYYLHGLATAGGYKVIIGNLYIGGAPLDLHWKNAMADKAVYEYRKIGIDGKKDRFPGTSLSKAIADEKWDYISLQQASPKSGLFNTYVEPLPLLFNYVKERAGNPNVKLVWHQTWAYAQNSTHSGFVSYDKDQNKMYQSIMSASKQAMKLVPFNVLVPAGTAIQNARTKLGDVLCRDGYHLDLGVGRYTASCTWYEIIFNENVVGNSYRPEKVSAQQAEIAQQAAHKAARKPYKVSKIK